MNTEKRRDVYAGQRQPDFEDSSQVPLTRKQVRRLKKKLLQENKRAEAAKNKRAEAAKNKAAPGA